MNVNNINTLTTLPDSLMSEAPCDSFALDVKGISASYGGSIRLKGVSVAFPHNHVTAILGPSGCGKSTLLRTLNRTLELVPGARVLRGSVVFDGVDIYGRGIAASWVRTHIGMVQQKPTPFPMSIIDNVLFGVRYHGLSCDPLAYAREYLERVGLWHEVKDRLKTSAQSLSGGQQQRLCLARTLAVRPRVVLMDEPCSALDPRSTTTIEGLVRDLACDYPIVIVTHNIAQAQRIAGHCVFMLDGEAIDIGPKEDILIKSRNPVVRDFVTGAVG